MPNFTTITGPAHWASYFINDDATSLDDEEQRQADAWLERENVRIISVADGDDGEMMEPYFTWSFAIHAPECGVNGGDVLDYIAEQL